MPQQFFLIKILFHNRILVELWGYELANRMFQSCTELPTFDFSLAWDFSNGGGGMRAYLAAVVRC